MTTTRVDLLRHGVCEDGQIYRGRTDSALTPAGEQQMLAVLEGLQWQTIITSPLQRCQKVARALAQRYKIPLEVNPNLVELDFGDWEGCRLDEVWAAQQKKVMQFWQDPVRNPPPGGESLADMQARVVSVIHEIHHQHRGEDVLVVTHGGVVRLCIGYLLQMPIRATRQLSVDYGSLSRLELYPEVDSDGFASEVIFTNRVPTLATAEVFAADD